MCLFAFFFYSLIIYFLFVLGISIMPHPPVRKKPAVKRKQVVPVQSAGPGMVFSKQSFFLPQRGPGGGKVPAPAPKPTAKPFFNSNRFANHEPVRRSVYDRTTGEAYAEWVGDAAVCIHTGQELFRSRRNRDADSSLEFDFADEEGPAIAAPFDYSVPKQRHPNDFSVITEDILASGFITLDAFKAPDGAGVRLVDYEAFLKGKAASDGQ